MDVKLLTGTNLAYIGDAYYELYIRNYLLNKGITKARELTKTKIKYVSAHAHSYIFHKLEPMLNSMEMEYYKKGRNAKTKSHRKNVDVSEYNTSSGLESLIGYLYLTQQETRLEEIMLKIIEIVENQDENLR